MPTFTMMVGLSGSGKSYSAQELSAESGAIIHSSDRIREELCGDANEQSINKKVFEVLHERVVNDLKNGRDVIYDATNIDYKRRMTFLSSIKKIPCEKNCFFMATPFHICLKRNSERERVVPDEVIERMYRRIWVPGKYEGWDNIYVKFSPNTPRLSISHLIDCLSIIPQDNPHHTLTIGQHCVKCSQLVSDRFSEEVKTAALLHDIGKPFTKTFVDCRGNTSNVAHYYDHQYISAYNSLFYDASAVDHVYVANLIQWHMRPFEFERPGVSAKATDKVKRLLGDKMFSDLMELHRADVAAH